MNRLNSTWGKADLHLHTNYSDGYWSPADTLDLIAALRRVNVIAITDHDTAEGAFVAQAYARQHCPDLDVIVGQEVTTGDGDIIGLYLTASLPRFQSAGEAIEAIHRQGGLAVAVHPFVFSWDMMSVGRAIRYLPFDAVEVRHGCPLSRPAILRAKINNSFGQRLPELGGSDSHIPYTVGQAFTWFPGRSQADLRRAIESGTVRPGGVTWRIPDMLRKLPVVLNARRAAAYQMERR